MDTPTICPKGRHQKRKPLKKAVKPDLHQAIELLREDIALNLKKLKKFSQLNIDAIKASNNIISMKK